MPTESPGRQVFERARRGDERAFETVVDAYGAMVLNLAWRMVRDRTEAEDLAQEVFLRLHRAFHRYDPDRPFAPWLRRVATNLLINLSIIRIHTRTFAKTHPHKNQQRYSSRQIHIHLRLHKHLHFPVNLQNQASFPTEYQIDRFFQAF